MGHLALGAAGEDAAYLLSFPIILLVAFSTHLC